MRAELGAADLFYTTHGAGMPLLAMHGIGFDHATFRPWLDPLGDAATLVFFDHRGNGRSRPPHQLHGVTHETWIADAEALRAYLGLERVVVFGHSYGGFLAMEYALSHPQSVAGLILCSTAAALDYADVQLENLRARAPARVVDLVMGMLSAPVGSDERFHAIWREVLPAYFHAWDPSIGDVLLRDLRLSAAAQDHAFAHCLPSYGLLERLGEIDAPALVAVGNDDWVTPEAQARRIHERLRRSELVVFQESGHFPYVEEQAQFVEVVRGWLRRLA